MENFRLFEDWASSERKLEHLSFSSLKYYIQCPYKFYLMKVVDKVPYGTSEFAVLGTGVHAVMEYVFNCKANKEKINSVLFLKIYKDTVSNEIEKINSAGFEFNEAQILKIYSVDAYFLRQVVSNVLNEVGDVAEDFKVEEKINFPLRELGYDTDLTFEARIDLLYKQYDKYVIRDWKTATKIWDEKKKGDFLGNTAQLCLYKYFLHKQTGIEPKNIKTVYSIFKQTKPYAISHWESSYTMKQLDSVLGHIGNAVKSYEEKNYPRTYNCVDYHGFKSDYMCPAFCKKELCDACEKNVKVV